MWAERSRARPIHDNLKGRDVNAQHAREIDLQNDRTCAKLLDEALAASGHPPSAQQAPERAFPRSARLGLLDAVFDVVPSPAAPGGMALEATVSLTAPGLIASQGLVEEALLRNAVLGAMSPMVFGMDPDTRCMVACCRLTLQPEKDKASLPAQLQLVQAHLQDMVTQF